MRSFLYIVFCVFQWCISIYLITQHYQWRQSTGFYKSDGDSIAIPIAGYCVLQLLLLPVYIWTAMYCVRGLNGKKPGKAYKGLTVILAMFFSINVYFLIGNMRLDLVYLSANSELWLVWIASSVFVILAASKQHNRSLTSR